VRFEWDPAKDRTNTEKHSVDFETASRVFADPNFVLVEDRVRDDGEQRWHAIGLVGGGRLLVAVHVYREAEDSGEEIIRIISARKAGECERRTYFQ
jgi:uncharacterized DUF497 family protein